MYPMAVLKILVEPSIFRYGRCGMTRYYSALCSGLQQAGVAVSIPFVASNCDFPSGLSSSVGRARALPMGARILDALSERLFHRAVQSGDYDWILATSPTYDSRFLAVRPKAKVLLVVHDLMSCVTAPDGLYDAPGPGLTALLYLAARAAKIVCISHDTAQALLKHRSVDPALVSVVHTGNLLGMSRVTPAQLPLPERYLLFVGERTGRKGFYAAVEALAPLFTAEPDLHLVCTGALRATEVDYLHRLGIRDRVIAVPADDAALVRLYLNAVCLVYPSLYEGFGLPVIEAMQLGCPVITTRCGALAEIAGDAALTVDPFHPQEIAEAVTRLLHESDLSETLRARGKERASSFSMEKMLHTFRQVLQGIPSP